MFTNRLILFVFFGSRSEIGVELVHSLCYLSSHFSLVLFWRRFLLGCIFVLVESEACLCFPAHFFAFCHAGISKMPLRDEQGRFCGTLQRKEADGHWERNFFVLDEDKYLLRYFSYMNADQEEDLDWDAHDGEINIRLITKVEDKSKSDDKSMPEGSFEIQTCNERFYVRADTKEGTEEWIRTLRKAAVNPRKKQEPKEENMNSPPSENNKENADSNGKTERICYETKIIGGVVVKTPVRKVIDSDSDGGSPSSDLLKRSGSAGMASVVKPIKEGYLVKKGALVKNWKRRYFRLDFLKLAYYEKETDKDPIKVINSSDIITAKESPGVENREHVFEVLTPSRTFLIQGSTAEEMHSWIDAICSAALRGRSSSEPESKRAQELVAARGAQRLKTY